MRKFLIMAGMLPLVSSSVYAKLGVGLSVKVVAVHASDEKVSSELREGIEARLNSTERYTVTIPNLRRGTWNAEASLCCLSE